MVNSAPDSAKDILQSKIPSPISGQLENLATQTMPSNVPNSSTNPEPQSQFTKDNSQPEDAETMEITSELKKGLANTNVANDTQNKIIDMMEWNYNQNVPFASVIQENIITAINKIMNQLKDELYTEIKKIVDGYTNKFLDDGEIKLQILYSILSYNIDTENEKCCDKSFAISYEIFEESIGKLLVLFKEKKGKGITLDKKKIYEECIGENGIMSILNTVLLTKQAVQKSDIAALKNVGGKSRKKRYNKSRKSKKTHSKKYLRRK